MMMPEVSGVDLARMIQEAAPTTRIVFMSAFPAEVLVREGLRDPRVHFLAKPFTRQELLTAVERALDSHQTDPSSSPRSIGHTEA